LDITERKFLFPNRANNISRFQLQIINFEVKSNILILMRSSIKEIIIFSIYIILWIYTAVFIRHIYKEYGKNIVKICIMPLILMIFIKLFITFTFMLFLSAFILHFWGDYFLNMRKMPILQNILFSAFVSPLAFQHYSALMIYRKLLKEK